MIQTIKIEWDEDANNLIPERHKSALIRTAMTIIHNEVVDYHTAGLLSTAVEDRRYTGSWELHELRS